MQIIFWGVHGSLPRPGPKTIKYGGNTPCVEVRCGEELLIFDAGTGIRDLGQTLMKNASKSEPENLKGHIFFSHLHWDHIQGFPFFSPLFVKGNEFHLYGAQQLHCSVRKLLKYQMAHPNFPVELEDVPGTLYFHDISCGDLFEVGTAKVKVKKLNHPGGSLGFRVEQGGASVVYATDTDHVSSNDKDLAEFAENCDVLIFDGMFTCDQYWGISDNLSRESWGHSTWEAAVDFAVRAGAKQLVLFHHGNEDEQVEEMEIYARRKFANTVAAFEGLVIRL